MQKQDIEHNLSLLGSQLEELGIQTTIRLLMIGGGFMLTQIGNRATTDDVDVLVKDISDPQHSDDYRIFRNAVHFVAYDARLSDSWLSDNIGDFLRMAGPVPQGQLWRRFGRYLEVSIPPKAFILAHKLIAGRLKDEEDTRALFQSLHITKRQEAQNIVDKYITNKDIQESEEVQKKLNRFFSQE
ncbi:MAG TPA: hypothetical protein VGL94_13015 [Ktedonobacteraceae bacterium]|jgi:hypothetical protein